MGSVRTAASIAILALLLPARWSAADTLQLQWDPPAYGVAAGYVLWCGTAPGTYSRSIDVGLVTTSSFDSLSPGTTYYFVVQAYNAEGAAGALSNELTATTLPLSPTSLAASVRDGLLLDLDWEPPSGTVSGYRIEVGTAVGASNVTTITVGTATAFTISSLSAGTYYIRVRSVNTAGVGPASNEVVVTLLAAPSPAIAPPTSLLATTRDGQFIDLTWQASSGAITGYRIEVGTTAGASNVRTIATGTATTFTISDLSAGTYYMRARSVNAGGVSAPGNEVVVTLVAAPNPPTSLSATIRDSQFIDLRWQAPSGTITGFRIDVGTTAGASNVRTVTTGTATAFTISDLAVGTYYIRVLTVNAVGVSPPGNEVVVTLAATSSAPTGLSGITRDGQFIDLTWQPPTTAVSGYRVEVGTGSGRSDVETSSVGAITSATLTNLSGGPYYIRVRSVSGLTVSAPSNEVVVSSMPLPPSGLAAAIRKRRIVDLTWQAPGSGASSYRVEVGTAAGQSNVRTVTTVGTSLTIDDLSSGTYYIRVRSGNDAGLSVPSNEVGAEVVQGGRAARPRTLTATMTESTSIDLTWEAAEEEVVSYRVEVGTAPGETNVSSFTTGDTTSFSISELPPDTYYIRVLSVSEDGLSEPSNEVVVSRPGGSDAPRRLSATVIDRDVLHLTWEAPQDASGVAGYEIEAGAGPGRTDIGRVTSGGLEFTSPHVPDGTYFLRVRSMKSTGPGSASNEVVAHVGARPTCTQPPSMPSILATVVDGLVELSWSAGLGDVPTGYVLDVGSARGRRDITTMPLGADVTTLRARAPNGTYALRLIAVNACGASPLGADTSVTVGGLEVTEPGAPIGLEQQVAGRSARLTWSAAASGGTATSYVIDILSSVGQLLLSLDTGNLSTVFTHGDAPPGVYTVRVRGVNAVGAGAPSNAITVTIR